MRPVAPFGPVSPKTCAASPFTSRMCESTEGSGVAARAPPSAEEVASRADDDPVRKKRRRGVCVGRGAKVHSNVRRPARENGRLRPRPLRGDAYFLAAVSAARGGSVADFGPPHEDVLRHRSVKRPRSSPTVAAAAKSVTTGVPSVASPDRADVVRRGGGAGKPSRPQHPPVRDRPAFRRGAR